MSSTAAVVCMTSSTRTMERVFVASTRSVVSMNTLVCGQAVGRRICTHCASRAPVYKQWSASSARSQLSLMYRERRVRAPWRLVDFGLPDLVSQLWPRKCVLLFQAFIPVIYSPPFPCLTVVGRERGAGTSSTQIVVKRESKVKPTIEAFKMSPKRGEPHGRSYQKWAFL